MSKLKPVFLKFLRIILTIPVAILIPLLTAFIAIPFGIFRQIIKISAKWLRPDLGPILAPRNQTTAIDDLFTAQRNSITSGFVAEGTVDVEKWKEVLTLNVLNKRDAKGELQYPHLTQRLTSWMGYCFWKDDETFDIHRHVTTPNNPMDLSTTYSDSDIQDMFNELAKKSWDKNRPIWEVVWVTNYYPGGMKDTPHSIMFFKFHHTLGDGYSFLKLFSEGLTDQGVITENAEPTFSRRSFLSSLGFLAVFPFMVGYEFAEIFIRKFDPLVPFAPLGTRDESYYTILAEKMSVKRIKEIKNYFKVSFASVINAVLAGGLAEILTKKGEQLPDSLLLVGILPLPRKTDKLENYMTMGMHTLPLRESNPTKSVMFCKEDYEHVKRSALPVVIKYLFVVLGLIPINLMRSIWTTGGNLVNTGITTLPFGYKPRSFDGNEFVEIFYAGGVGPLGLVFCCVSYVDVFRISLQCKHSIMTKEELIELTHLLQKHVEILHKETLKAN